MTTRTAAASRRKNFANQFLLQHDGRMAYVEMAQELGVSQGTIRYRAGGMKQAGRLRFVAQTDPMTGAGVTQTP